MTTPRLPDEFELIERYFAPLAQGFPGAYGLLDDVAVISPEPGNELVVKSDVIVAGVDFPHDTSPDLVARKALRVNLSDLAAKAAAPRAYLLALLLPSSVDEAWISGFAAGLRRDQAEYGLQLVGGDLSSTAGPVAVAITAIGETPIGQTIRRGGAQADDTIFVTGTVGDAALGLRALRAELRGLDARAVAALIDRYRVPQPRVTLGLQLRGVASAAIDISDGLLADLQHVCAVSRRSAVIEVRSLPLSPAARAAIGDDRQRLETALTGGDDYEILFTAPPTAAARINALSRSSGVPITAIGRMTESSGSEPPHAVVLDAEGRTLKFTAAGWTHFGKRH